VIGDGSTALDPREIGAVDDLLRALRAHEAAEERALAQSLAYAFGGD
jgi:hypothetical protein